MGETAADEQDLAKALDNVAGALSDNMPPATISNIHGGGLAFEETASNSFPAPSDPLAVVPADSPVAPSLVNPVSPSDPEPARDDTVDTGPLSAIKKDALNELRPLVDKLNVSPEEKFDTYLLLIRSTDDVSLIGPAHEAAKSIDDETRRAEALLDIIKEIDYLSQSKK